jgi:hypothetical protein
MPNISNLETGLQDVVVVLHDGGFSHGSGDIAMYGPDYLLDHDVVMVTCNYRLGALGKMISITRKLTPWKRLLLEKLMACSASQEIPFLFMMRSC